MHPEVLKRLRAEVLEKVGPKQRPTYADVKEMRYLRAVINETLRLYPAVLGSPSYCRYGLNTDTVYARLGRSTFGWCPLSTEYRGDSLTRASN